MHSSSTITVSMFVFVRMYVNSVYLNRASASADSIARRLVSYSFCKRTTHSI
jgi:hypothetical protein